MSTKNIIWIFLFIGSTIGGFIPSFWGASFLSMSSIIGSTIGGLLGIWIGFKIGTSLNS